MRHVTKDLSDSSDGELATDRDFNPFIKAISTQRKDFSYTTQIRKEVIHIVDPFRVKVLNFDERLNKLEKNMTEIVEHIKDEESKNVHKLN